MYCYLGIGWGCERFSFTMLGTIKNKLWCSLIFKNLSFFIKFVELVNPCNPNPIFQYLYCNGKYQSRTYMYNKNNCYLIKQIEPSVKWDLISERIWSIFRKFKSTRRWRKGTTAIGDNLWLAETVSWMIPKCKGLFIFLSFGIWYVTARGTWCRNCWNVLKRDCQNLHSDVSFFIWNPLKGPSVITNYE